MPSEHRQIIFSMQEIVAALSILAGETRNLPRGRIVCLAFLEESETITALVSIVAPGGARRPPE